MRYCVAEQVRSPATSMSYQKWRGGGNRETPVKRSKLVLALAALVATVPTLVATVTFATAVPAMVALSFAMPMLFTMAFAFIPLTATAGATFGITTATGARVSALVCIGGGTAAVVSRWRITSRPLAGVIAVETKRCVRTARWLNASNPRPGREVHRTAAEGDASGVGGGLVAWKLDHPSGANRVD